MEPVNWYDGQWRTAIIAKEGRKFMYVIVFDSGGVRLKRIKRTERRYMKPLMYKGKPYPIRRAVRRYRQFGRDYGITKGAYRALVEEPRQRVLDSLAVRKEA
jgi:hypothetical protein